MKSHLPRVGLTIMLSCIGLLSGIPSKGASEGKSHFEQPDFVLGVFATNKTRSDLLASASLRNIYAYNLNSESKINFASKTVDNVWMFKDGQWHNVEKAPLPQVVYDFGFFKNLKGKRLRAKAAKDGLTNNNIPFINPTASYKILHDKILFADIMKEHNVLHPEISSFTKADLKRMRKNHDILFIKPTFGNKGYGIIVVERHNNRFSLNYKMKNEKKEWITIEKVNIKQRDLHKEISYAISQFNDETKNYFIQQGVDTFKLINKQTDLRVTVQRDHSGSLGVTSIIARVGGNISQGGRLTNEEDLFTAIEQEKNIPSRQSLEQVRRLSLATVEALEKHSGLELGDVGLDVVFDQQGRAFIIEANDKSGYTTRYASSFLEGVESKNYPAFVEKVKDMDHQRNLKILGFAQFLAKKSIRSEK